MRSLLYIVICTVGLACVTPAWANKATLPHRVALTLNQSVSTGQSLSLNTSMSALSDFYRGSAFLSITTEDGVPVGLPIELFKGDGYAGFSDSGEVELPPLKPGRYKLQALFKVYLKPSDRKPTISGSNLYLEISSKQVFSSPISFGQIKRQQLAQQLESRDIGIDDTDLSPAGAKLRQQALEANAVKTMPVENSVRLVAKPGSSLSRQSSVSATTIAVSAPTAATPDPRKVKSSGIDKANAVDESSLDSDQ